MKEIHPELRLIRTDSGTRLYIRISLSKGFVVKALNNSHQRVKEIDLQVIPSKEVIPADRELTFDLPPLNPREQVVVNILNLERDRVGGGVVVYEDLDEK